MTIFKILVGVLAVVGWLVVFFSLLAGWLRFYSSRKALVNWFWVELGFIMMLVALLFAILAARDPNWFQHTKLMPY